jgi:hypothetical protein
MGAPVPEGRSRGDASGSAQWCHAVSPSLDGWSGPARRARVGRRWGGWVGTAARAGRGGRPGQLERNAAVPGVEIVGDRRAIGGGVVRVPAHLVEDQHPVTQLERLGQVVGDHEDGHLRLGAQVLQETRASAPACRDRARRRARRAARMRGLAASACAMASRCCMPPDSAEGYWSATWTTRSAPAPRRPAPAPRVSRCRKAAPSGRDSPLRPRCCRARSDAERRSSAGTRSRATGPAPPSAARHPR